MRVSYGVLWRSGGGEPVPARLRIAPTALVLTGLGEEGRERAVPLAEIVAVETRPLEEKRSTVALDLRGGDRLELESNVDRQIVTQLLERLVADGLRGTQRLLVVAPLKPGARQAARELLRSGPPFSLDETPLLLHDVFLLDDQALFLFGSVDGAEMEEPPMPDLWAATGEWRELIAGEVRLAERAYSWSRGEHAAREPHVGLGFYEGLDMSASSARSSIASDSCSACVGFARRSFTPPALSRARAGPPAA